VRGPGSHLTLARAEAYLRTKWLLDPSSRFRRPFVKRFALCYQTVVCPVCLSVCLSVCDVGVLWHADRQTDRQTDTQDRTGQD